MNEHLRSYVHFLELEKNASKNTVASYKLDLVRYIDFLSARGITAINGIKESDVSGFLAMLRELQREGHWYP